MSDHKYCEDCKWFVDGHGYYNPLDRCANPVVLEGVELPVIRRRTPVVFCMNARDEAKGACATAGKLFERRPAPAIKATRSLFERIFGKRKRDADPNENQRPEQPSITRGQPPFRNVPPWSITDPHNHDDIR